VKCNAVQCSLVDGRLWDVEMTALAYLLHSTDWDWDWDWDWHCISDCDCDCGIRVRRPSPSPSPASNPDCSDHPVIPPLESAVHLQ